MDMLPSYVGRRLHRCTRQDQDSIKSYHGPKNKKASSHQKGSGRHMSQTKKYTVCDILEL